MASSAMRRSFTLLAGLLLLAACRNDAPSLAYVTPRIASPTVIGNTLVPTVNLATWTPTITPSPTQTPTPAPTATSTAAPTSTPTPTVSPTQIGTPLARETSAPTWTPPAQPPARLNDHYLLARPVADDATNWVDRTYPYGSTGGRRLPLHHGVEFVNARHTPVLAAAPGTVHFAGDDSSTQFGPALNTYGRLVVLRHDLTTPQGQALFTLYAHLETVTVEAGQRVTDGAQLGLVGDSGAAQGPHLHFEVRVGDPASHAATRNPELWLRPFRKFGTLAGRVSDSAGNLLREVTIHVRSTDLFRYAWSYAAEGVNGDADFSENFVLGDLPANYYEVTVGDRGRVRFRQTLYVWPGRTNWLELRLRD